MREIMNILFAPPEPVLWPIADRQSAFPIARIFCVGRNYAAHAREMGKDPERDPPFFFTKWADSYMPPGSTLAYPAATKNYHFEVELVVAMAGGGRDIAADDARQHIAGYGVGLDMTRRDLQLDAREKGRPWDTGKNFEESAPLGMLHLADDIGHPDSGSIRLFVNDKLMQSADLQDLIWSVDEVIMHLSHHYSLRAGDIIMTGTPAGVGPVVPGDTLLAHIDGLSDLTVYIGASR